MQGMILQIPTSRGAKINDVFEAENLLHSIGVTFDTGYNIYNGVRDWCLDYSFRGGDISDIENGVQLSFDSSDDKERLTVLNKVEQKLLELGISVITENKRDKLVWNVIDNNKRGMGCCSKHPFGENLCVIEKYDGIFLSAFDVSSKMLYIYENGGANEPYRYWALDFSNNLDLLERIFKARESIYSAVVNGLVPSKIVRVINFEYGKNFGDFLRDEDTSYIPSMIYKKFRFPISAHFILKNE